MVNSNFLISQKKLFNSASTTLFTKSFKRNIVDFLSYKNGLIRHVGGSKDRFDRRIILARKYADYEMRYRH